MQVNAGLKDALIVFSGYLVNQVVGNYTEGNYNFTIRCEGGYIRVSLESKDVCVSKSFGFTADDVLLNGVCTNRVYDAKDFYLLSLLRVLLGVCDSTINKTWVYCIRYDKMYISDYKAIKC